MTQFATNKNTVEGTLALQQLKIDELEKNASQSEKAITDLRALKTKIEKDLAIQKKTDEAKIAKIVSDARKTLESQIFQDKNEMDNLKTQNVVKLTQQIAKDKADSERQIRVQKALTDTMIKNAVGLYQK